MSKNDKGQAGKAVDTYDVYLKRVVIDHAEVYGDNAEKALKAPCEGCPSRIRLREEWPDQP